MEDRLVLKFGGTSMGTSKSLKHIKEILTEPRLDNTVKVVVCSALGGVTDQLEQIGKLADQANMNAAHKLFEEIYARHLDIAKDFGVEESYKSNTDHVFKDLSNLITGMGLIQELSQRSKALLLSYGERLSTRLLKEILLAGGIPANQFDSTFIRTLGKRYAEDNVDWPVTRTLIAETLTPWIKQGHVIIVTGFFGVNHQGHVSLLGRGGSDFTAAILAVGLGIPKVEIWTDVEGFLTADPRIVPEATLINEIGFIEASELCFFGAKVLHPKTIRPVIDMGGAVYIRNTFNHTSPGTRISKDAPEIEDSVVSITSKKVHVFAFDIFGTNKQKTLVFSELFDTARDFDIPIDMIASSEALISFCIDERTAENAGFTNALKEIAPLTIEKDRRIICVVSPGSVQGKSGVAAEFFTAFANEGISLEMYSQNNSEIAQLMVVKEEDAEKGIRAIHNKYV